MFLTNERAYCLHELSLELGHVPSASLALVDDTGGQVIALDGALRRLDLTCTGLWTGQPITLDEMRLEPTSRDVAAVLMMRDHALTLEVEELHTHYRRVAVYESWMPPIAHPDAPAALPAHLHLRRLRANVPRRQLELEIDAGDARQLVSLGGVVGLELLVDARNANAFVQQVDSGRLSDATREALLDASGRQRGARLQLERALSRLDELRLVGADVAATILLERG